MLINWFTKLLPKKRSDGYVQKENKNLLDFPGTSCKLRQQADWVTPLNPVGLLFITFVTSLPELFVMFVHLET